MLKENLDKIWEKHTAEWRDPAQITSQWKEADCVDKKLLKYQVVGDWWETLASFQITLLITREYEHLIIALSHDGKKPCVSFQPMPHPSGLVVDRTHQVISVASTRNPNQIFDFEPITRQLTRSDISVEKPVKSFLIPTKTRFYPGCMYFHDIALISGALYANAVAHNAIVKLEQNGSYERIWWPRCIETAEEPIFHLNHLQLNSIAGGDSISSSYFSASTDKISKSRPGHKNFAVDKRGVIFCGTSREPVVRGLTRPHSARLHQEKLWVDNSGYGEMGFAEDARLTPIVKLPGWTRGLCLYKNIAFVGTSRIIPNFRHYAPGLSLEDSVCGIHAVNIQTGKIVGSLIWPVGNQIFAIDWMPNTMSRGFPFNAHKRAQEKEKGVFYSFETKTINCKKSS